MTKRDVEKVPAIYREAETRLNRLGLGPWSVYQHPVLNAIRVAHREIDRVVDSERELIRFVQGAETIHGLLPRF